MYTAMLRMGETGSTVTIQNWMPASSEYLWVWNTSAGAWAEIESPSTSIDLDQTTIGDTVYTTIDTSVFQPDDVLRFVYRDADGVAIDDELVYIDAAGEALPTIDQLIHRLIELSPEDEWRFTAEALDLVIPDSTELNPLPILTDNGELQLMYRVTKEFDPPEAGSDVAKVQVHHAHTLDADVWPVIHSVDYTGQISVTFDTEYAGYFRLSFEASDGSDGPMTEAFTVGFELDDLDLKFKITKDCKKYRVGDHRYMTLEITDTRHPDASLPTTRISIWNPSGTLVVDEELALLMEREARILLNLTDSATPTGKWTVRGTVFTTYETIVGDTMIFAVSPT